MDSFQTCANHPEVTAGLVNCARCGRAFCPDCVVDIDGKPYDAACKNEQVRDLQSGTTGSAIGSALARFGGIFVDGLVLSPISIYIAVKYAGETSMFSHYGERSLLPAVAFMVYGALMLQYKNGQTLGKMAAKTRVTRLDGSPVEPGQIWLREISRTLMNLTYILGLVDGLMVFSKDRRMLHDRIAGTIVVSTRT